MRMITFVTSATIAAAFTLSPLNGSAQLPKPPARQDSVRADSARRVPSQLAPVRVSARRWKRPSLTQTLAGDPSGGERDGSPLGVSMLDQGSLAGIGATVPALTALAGVNGASLSAMGLPSAQTATTLNGVTFSANELPRELFAPARVVTTTFDVAQSGFAGAQLALRTYPGSVFTNGSLTTRLQSPLSGAPGVPSATVPPFGLSGSRSGPAFGGRLLYNAAGNVDRSASRAVTLYDAAIGRVTAPGLSSEIAASTLRLLDSLGVPASTRSASTEVATQSGSAFLRLDLAPKASRSANLVVYGSRGEVRPLPVGPFASPSLAGRRTNSAGALLVEHSKLLRGRFLSFVRGGLSVRNAATDPVVALPQGRVLVPAGTALDADRTTITFGGTGANSLVSATQRLELRPGLSWYSASGRHLWRLTNQISRERLKVTDSGDRTGALHFSSLDQLRAGRPASYVSQVGQREFESAAWNAGLSLGDQWRPNDALLVNYGLRVDGDRLAGTAPAATDGMRETRVQSTSWFLSPRAGFSWNHGSISQVGLGERPRGTVRGGIGAFRGVQSPGELRSPLLYGMDSRGLQQIECVGAAAPPADWRAWANGAALPGGCADGAMADDGTPSTTSVHTDVVTLARNYVPATSWRSSVGWTGEIGHGLQLSADVTASRTSGLAGTRYSGTFDSPSFRVAGEAGRPVYVDVSRIDEQVGLAPLAGTRRTATLHSDLRSRALQVAASLSPSNVSPAARLLWGVGYAWTNAQNQNSGFDGTTAGDPRMVEWMRSPFAARHRITGFAALRFTNGAFITMGAQRQSGLPFTPLVGGDINGDGLLNDRAFVSDSSSRRSCLRGQLGQLAAAGSCRGPAQTSLNATIVMPGVLLKLPSRSTVTVGISNPLAGLDQLLHGRDARGWGQIGSPDPVLLHPVGFDRDRREFRYAVNPAFGDIRRDALTSWQGARLTIDVRMPLSRPQHEQLLQQVMAPGRERAGVRLTAEQVKQRYMSFGVINPVQALYRVRDSLYLTDGQRDEMEQLVRAFDIRLESIWGPLASSLAAADRRYDHDAMLAAVRQSQRQAWDALEVAVGSMRTLLTSAQLAMIDPSISALLDPGAIARLRRTEFRF